MRERGRVEDWASCTPSSHLFPSLFFIPTTRIRRGENTYVHGGENALGRYCEFYGFRITLPLTPYTHIHMNTITQARYFSLRSVSRRPRTPPPNHPCRLRWLQFRTRIRFTCTVCGPQDHKFNRRIFQEPGGSWIFGSDSLGNIGHNQPITLIT